MTMAKSDWIMPCSLKALYNVGN
uniref:Uncharacterized protein n=1 Tax=Anguilla anguilla TaxID=7936 RepID=A0A0E9UCU4_ANGAN